VDDQLREGTGDIMSERTTKHDTFVIERKFPQAPERVFNAFADPAAKARWFSGPPDQWTQTLREFDFRIGGRERLIGAWAGGKVSSFDSVYQDIVPNERIIYSYAMQIDGVPISVSAANGERTKSWTKPVTSMSLFTSLISAADSRGISMSTLSPSTTSAESSTEPARSFSSEILRVRLLADTRFMSLGRSSSAPDKS
jgi:uncharacterized protein YndB with AHSA1/START domain